MRKLTDVPQQQLKNKKVLVRVSFNVPIKDGDAKQKFRIAAAKETVDYLIDAGAQVTLLSHIGRPSDMVTDKECTDATMQNEVKELQACTNNNKYYTQALSMAQLTDDVAQILGHPVAFADDCIGKKVTNILKGVTRGTVTLLENVRFHAEEVSDNSQIREDFAKKVVAPFDLFVQDAFSVAHRDHASVTGCARIIESCAGIQFVREVETLSRVRITPEHPAVAIIGGAKIATKLPLIRVLEDKYDSICVGGKVANEAIDEKLNFNDAIILPHDFVGERFDIGPETAQIFVEKIMTAQTVVWNGPMGWYEKEEYAQGTRSVVESLAKTRAYTVVGGGESIEALEHYGVLDKIDFISTGGGSMLAFMTGKDLPGIEVLKK